MAVFFRKGDKVAVSSAEVRRETSGASHALHGLVGTVAEEVEEHHAVTVDFAFGAFAGPGHGTYRYPFAEDELERLERPGEANGSDARWSDAAGAVGTAATCLAAFDAGHRRAAQEGGGGPGHGAGGPGAAAANAFADGLLASDRAQLRASIQALLADGEAGGCERVALGICAPGAAEALACLRRWVSALGLPRGKLHGMDLDGEAIEVPGSVYVKYNSGTRTFAEVRANGGQAWRPGDAFLNSYDGAYRGVGLVVHRGAGDDEGSSQLDQYAYLPLDLF